MIIKEYKYLLSATSLKSININNKRGGKRVQNFFKSFVFSRTNKLGDLYANRERLLFGNNSLANRLVNLKKSNPDNIIFKYLSPEISADFNSPNYIASDLINASPLDRLEWQVAIQKANDGEYGENIQKFVKDFVKYTYLIGGIQNSRSSVSSFPSKIINELQGGIFDDLLTNSKLAENAVIQFYQHYPEYLNVYDKKSVTVQNIISKMPINNEGNFARKGNELITEITTEPSKVSSLYGRNEIETTVEKPISSIFSALGLIGDEKVSVNELVNKVIGALQFKGIELKVYSDNLNLLLRVSNKLGLNTKVTITNDSSVNGLFIQENELILLNPDNIKDINMLLQVLTEEVTHSIVDKYIDMGNTAPKEIQESLLKLKRLQSAFAKRKENESDLDYEKREFIGNFKEFIAKSISNKKMQEWLNSENASDNSSFLDELRKFIDKIIKSALTTLGLIDINNESFAILTLSEVENLLNNVDNSVTLQNSNKEYIEDVNKVLSDNEMWN